MKDEFCNEITYNKKWNTIQNANKVSKLLNKYPTKCVSNCPNSWVDEVIELLDKINKYYPDVKIIQYKEKYGYLRVYFSGTKDLKERQNLEKIIDKTEIKIVKKLKYPYKIYKCNDCGHESLIVSVEDSENKNTICFYCGGKLKVNKN